MTALRAGLVGLGMMGRNHARVLRSLDGVVLVAAADQFGDTHSAAAGLPVEDSVDALLRHDLDFCIVAVPTAEHLAVGLQLAEAGVHALVEKPLAAETAGATQLAQAFAGAGLIGAVGHIERFNPSVQQLRARVQDGFLGDLYQIATRRQGPFPNRIADVGVVKDLATHDLDLAAFVTGQDYLSVSARTAHRSGRPHEDLVAVVASLSGGTIANHLVNWLSPMKERCTVATGERGTLVADTLTADLTYFANGIVPTEWDAVATFRGVSEGDMTRYAFPKPEPLRSELETFRDAVLGKDSGIVTMVEGLRTVAVAEALIASAQTAGTVEIIQPSRPLSGPSRVMVIPEIHGQEVSQ